MARTVTANGAHVFTDGYIAAHRTPCTRGAVGRDSASSTSGWIALAYDWFGESCSSAACTGSSAP
jgi:hypothetical protein